MQKGVRKNKWIFAFAGLILLAFFLVNIERFFPTPVNTLPQLPVAVRVNIDAARGTNPGAPLTLIEFTDFQCPYCAAALPIIKELEARYGDKLNVIIAHFPVRELHPRAEEAAEAAECAREQGKFSEYHDVLFQNQDQLGEGKFADYAQIIGLEVEKFSACLSTHAMRDSVQKDVQAGLAVGVRGTPTFFANGIIVEGVQPLESFTAIFEAEE